MEWITLGGFLALVFYFLTSDSPSSSSEVERINADHAQRQYDSQPGNRIMLIIIVIVLVVIAVSGSTTLANM